MKYIKIKSVDGRIFIIDLEKVVSCVTGSDFVNINYYENDFFHFTKENEKYGTQIEKFEALKTFIENLGEEL